MSDLKQFCFTPYFVGQELEKNLIGSFALGISWAVAIWCQWWMAAVLWILWKLDFWWGPFTWMAGNAGSCLELVAREHPMDGGVWRAAVHGVAMSRTRLSDFTFTFHFHASEKEMATHSSVLAWRIPGMGEPGGLPSMGSHRVGHDWSDLAAAAEAFDWRPMPWRCRVTGFINFKGRNVKEVTIIQKNKTTIHTCARVHTHIYTHTHTHTHCNLHSVWLWHTQNYILSFLLRNFKHFPMLSETARYIIFMLELRWTWK